MAGTPSPAPDGGGRRWSALGLVARLGATALALAAAVPVATILALLVTGMGDPGKQVFLPVPVFLLQLALALAAPFAAAVAIGWWGLWAVRVGGRVRVGALVGGLWLLYAGLLVLDWNWDRVGPAPPGHLWLRNATGEPATYATSPPADDLTASVLGTREMRPGERSVLTGLPGDAPLRVRATDATGRTVYCRDFTPDDIRRAWGRVDVAAGMAACP